MPTERVQRRLAAILAADVVGYSRLVRADEEGTLSALKGIRKDLIDPKIAEHHGRIVKLMGDGTLAEFGSAVDAVRCAVELQQAMAEREADVPDDCRIRYRVGVNLGDIVIEDGDVFGDGVNIASRLEGLAQPGGICISDKVYEEVRDRIDLPFVDIGEQNVKNIDRPVRVWQWPTADLDEGPITYTKRPDGIPLLAVLSFEVLSEDVELANLGRVLTRSVTNEMSGRTGIKLIAASMVARLEKSDDVAIDTVRDRLGADFVLCGTVAGNADRVRVQVELVETNGGAQIWAETFDRARGDLLGLADDFTSSILATSRTANVAFLGWFYEDTPDEALTNNQRLAKASAHFYRITPDDLEAALAQIDAVLACEPNHAMALTMRAIALSQQYRFRLEPLPATQVDEANELIERALTLNLRSDTAYWTRGEIALFLKGDAEQALADAERALELNPHYSLGRGLMGQVLCYAGRLEEGIAHIRRTIEIDRLNPINACHYGALALDLFIARKPEEGLMMVGRGLQLGRPIPELRLIRAALLEDLDRHNEASTELALLRRQHPSMRMGKLRLPPFSRPDHLNHFTNNLSAAGLPQ